MMKKTVCVLLFCAVAITYGYSQTKQESIKELFRLMQQDSLVDRMFTSMTPAMFNQMNRQIKDSASIAHTKEAMKSTWEIVREISKRMINEDMVVSYDKYFSQNEINDLITFYKSPSGQKFIKVSPDIQKEMAMVMMQKYMPEMIKAIKARSGVGKNSETK